MSKKIISLALALIMCLALIPMTALAASTCEKIENDYSNAAPLSVGSKVEVGKKQTAPPPDFTYYNVNYKYSFTITDPSLVTVTLTTENPPSSEYKPHYLGMKLMCADEKTEIIPLDRSRSDNIEVHSGEDRLSDKMSYKLLPGKYYLWVDSRTSNNAYGWLQINSVTATQEDFGGEPNDTTLLAQAKASIGTGVDYKGNISYEGNKEGKDNYNMDRYDYYRFDVPSDGYGIKLTVTRADTTVVNNIEAYLCDVDYDTRDFSGRMYLKDTPTGSVEYKNLKKGTVYVAINGSWTTSLETEYTLRLDPLDGSAATQPPTTQPPVTQPPAADTPSSWAAEQVDKAIAEKLVPQSLQSKYTQATTRAEFCALAVALYENIKGTITGRTTFTDTKDVNVEKAASIGVVSGVGNNKFDPDAKLTREQAAVMLSRLAEAVGKPFEKKAATFADNGKVSSWALEGVGQVQAAGIMGGVGSNTFAPKDPYTREQSIITILRTYDAVKGGGTTDPTKPTDPPVSEDQNIVGAWSVSPKLKIGEVREWVEFKSDGTFKYYSSFTRVLGYFHESNKYTRTGKYTVSDGKIYCTNIIDNLEVTKGSPSGNQSYENKSQPDCVWTYKFTTESFNKADYGDPDDYVDVLWLNINFYPNDPDTLLNKYTKFAKPF